MKKLGKILTTLLAFTLAVVVAFGILSPLMAPYFKGGLSTDGETASAAHNYFVAIRSGDVDRITALSHVDLVKEISPAMVTKLNEHIPGGEIEVRKRLWFNTRITRSGTTTAGGSEVSGTKVSREQSEYKTENGWVLVSVDMLHTNQGIKVTSFNVTPHTDAVRVLNQISFKEKSTKHYLVFALALLIATATLITLWVCWRSDWVRRKWLWLLFIAASIIQFYFTWNSETLTYSIASINIPPAKLSSGGISPPVIQLGIPVGVFAFWSLWMNRNNVRPEATPAPQPTKKDPPVQD